MIEKFIQENLERDVTSFLDETDLYARYLRFCDFHKLEPLTKTKLGNQLNLFNAGIRHKKMKNYVMQFGRQGVKLLPCKY